MLCVSIYGTFYDSTTIPSFLFCCLAPIEGEDMQHVRFFYHCRGDHRRADPVAIRAAARNQRCDNQRAAMDLTASENQYMAIVD